MPLRPSATQSFVPPRPSGVRTTPPGSVSEPDGTMISAEAGPAKAATATAARPAVSSPLRILDLQRQREVGEDRVQPVRQLVVPLAPHVHAGAVERVAQLEDRG